MMGSFIQLNWVMESPDIRSNTFLGMSVLVIPDKVNIGIRRLNKAD